MIMRRMEISTLVRLGFKPTVAKTLYYLYDKKLPVTSKDIEEGMHLRQPEVSLAIKELRDKNWIKETVRNDHKRGRPLLFISLHKTLVKQQIVDDIEKRIKTLEHLKREVAEW